MKFYFEKRKQVVIPTEILVYALSSYALSLFLKKFTQKYTSVSRLWVTLDSKRYKVAINYLNKQFDYTVVNFFFLIYFKESRKQPFPFTLPIFISLVPVQITNKRRIGTI